MESVQKLDIPTEQTAQELISNYLYFMEFVQSSSPHTLRAYNIDLGQFFQLPAHQVRAPYTPLLKVKKQKLQNLNKIIPRLLAQVFQSKWGKLSPASRNRKVATLKSFFQWATQEEVFDQDYSLRIQCPKIPVQIPHFMSVDEVLAILDTFSKLRDEELPLQYKVLFLLLYGGGLRIQEACSIKWSDVSWEKNHVRILGKGKKIRIVPLPRLVIARLKELNALPKNSEFTFTHQEKPLQQRVAYTWIQKIGELAGLQKPLHPHALRHSYATHLLTSGVNLRVLQNLLGHTSLRATEKYTHLDIHHLAEVIQKAHDLKKIKIAL